MSDDTLYGLLLACLAVAIPLSLGILVARRMTGEEEETRGVKSAPEVRRRTPVRSRTLRPEAQAPDRLTEVIAQLMRTVRGEVPSVPGRADAVRGDRARVPEVRVPFDPDLPHSPEELYQLAEAIRHKQRGLSKAEAIQRAFGVSKGGNLRYQRLARMFDLATDPAGHEASYRQRQDRLVEIQEAALVEE